MESWPSRRGLIARERTSCARSSTERMIVLQDRRAGGVKAELFDGTEAVTLVWLGQRRIAGIEPGRTLRVRGRLGKLENGSKAIYNPHYEIQR